MKLYQLPSFIYQRHERSKGYLGKHWVRAICESIDIYIGVSWRKDGKWAMNPYWLQLQIRNYFHPKEETIKEKIENAIQKALIEVFTELETESKYVHYYHKTKAQISQE